MDSFILLSNNWDQVATIYDIRTWVNWRNNIDMLCSFFLSSLCWPRTWTIPSKTYYKITLEERKTSVRAVCDPSWVSLIVAYYELTLFQMNNHLIFALCFKYRFEGQCSNVNAGLALCILLIIALSSIFCRGLHSYSQRFQYKPYLNSATMSKANNFFLLIIHLGFNSAPSKRVHLTFVYCMRYW